MKLIRFLSAIVVALVLMMPVYAVQLGGPGDQNGEAPTHGPILTDSFQDSTYRLAVMTAYANGGGTVSSTGTAVVGSGTSFQSALSVGDNLFVQGQAKRITAIADDTHLTINTGFSPDLNAGTSYQTARPLLVVDSSGKVGMGTDVPNNGLTVSTGIKAGSYTADPCGTLTEGAMFYNNTADSYCFCAAGNNDMQMAAPLLACF